MSSEEEAKVVKKNDDAPIIEEWVSDDEEEDVSQPKIEKRIVRPSIVKNDAYRDLLADFRLPTTFRQKQLILLAMCPVTILNTIDHLGKFDGKADESFFVGYSLNSKAFRVCNSKTRIVEENLHIRINESTPNVVGAKASDNADQKSSHDDGSKPSSDDGKKVDEDPRKESGCNDQEKEDNVNSANNINAAGTNEVNAIGGKISIKLLFDPNMPALEDYSIFDFSRNDEDDGSEADMNNLDTTIQVSPNPTTRIHKDHPLDQVKNPKRKIKEEVHVCQPPGFEDLDFPDRVYKVEKALYGLHQALRAWFTEVKTASTLMETQKPLLKDKDGEEVDVHMYRSMIGSLMYLTSSRPDNQVKVCASATITKVNPKFWATVKVKTVNGEVQLQALVDRKKIIITESIMRRDLQLEDDEGIDCLPNATIFEQLTLMGVLDLEEHKDCQAQEIISFKSRVKKVEKKGGSKLKAHKIIQAVIDDEGVFDRHDMLKKRLMWLEKEVSIAGVYMEEPVKTTKKKIKLVMSEEVASKTSASMQAELEEEDRIKNQEKLSIYQEKSKLLVKLLKQKDSTLQPIRVKEKRNKPPTKSSKKITMSTYLINMRAVQKACIAGTKKVLGGKKVDVDKERTEIQRLIEVVPINRKADESSKMYLVFSHMLKSFDNEDLETLWKLVKAKHGSTRPEESYDRVLWGDLKTMFDPHVKDQVRIYQKSQENRQKQLMEGDPKMEGIPWTLLAYPRISQSC
ncbi:ribonuclease H-like domain-containing protein [Tanacetum coccineum]